ncbi:hypothetical protein FOA52_012736 [Chlamydomonas sp. UWO 241]|nr:hypothetical protein FOA52_012736 [Chlamydomonas sp. UWO 241]
MDPMRMHGPHASHARAMHSRVQHGQPQLRHATVAAAAGSGSGAPEALPAPRITSTSNEYVKHCVRLRTSARYRADAGRCLLVGSELLREAAGDAGPLQARVLFVPETSTSGSGPAPPTFGIDARAAVVVSEGVLKKLTGLESVDGVGAVAELDLPPEADFSQPGMRVSRLLALDRVQDPGNLGTLLRTAVAFGWDGVFLLPGCADPFGDKAVRAGRGAALRAPIVRGDLAQLQALVASHHLLMVAAEPEEDAAGGGGGAPGQGTASGGVCLVLGSEGQGLSPEVLAACTPVAIPMAGRMESLNVGIAGGILMFMLSQGMGPLSARLDSLLGRREA